jgi:hypothetical protein
MVLALADTSEQHWLLGGGAACRVVCCSAFVARVVIRHGSACVCRRGCGGVVRDQVS